MANHHNNFGTLRLLFASLVIVAHTPELLDGNSSRELLTILFGSISFGGLAVKGFFLISGFLITKSMVERTSVLSFAARRAARILPGFMVVFWLCLLVLAPLVTVEPVFTRHVLVSNVVLALKLDMPWAPGVFAGNAVHALNGSLWTIAWEFLCYIGVGVLGVVGLLHPRFRYLLLAGVVAALGLHVALKLFPDVWPPGDVLNAVGFGSVFGTGAVYYLFRDRIHYTALGAVVCGAALLGLMFVTPLAETALAVFGGYLVFWFAFAVKPWPTSRLRDDISYGLYLYAFPVGQVLIWFWPQGNPWLIGLATFAGAIPLAFLSWRLVERPAMKGTNAWLANRKARQVLRQAVS